MSAIAGTSADQRSPLSADMEEWDADLRLRYPTSDSSEGSGSPSDAFRDYAAEVRPSVREFYRLNHVSQTYDFAVAKRAEYGGLDHAEMGVWEAMEYLNELVDDSDPDTDASQIEHLLQTSEAMRADNRPRWMILAGAMHDLGKILCLWGEPQWAVVGDTFPVGCAFSDKIVFSEYFADNPDSSDPEKNTKYGQYEPGCGFDQVVMSWGHDELIHRVVRDHLPVEASYVLRYHSFYPWHREGAYAHLASDHDRAMLPWVLDFNRYDLYTKADVRPDPVKLKGYYTELIDEFFPRTIRW